MAFITLFQTLLALFHAFIALLASRKLWQYSTVRREAAVVPLVACTLILLSAVVVTAYCAVDPFGAQHLLPQVYRRLMLLISVPLTFAQLLLILLFIISALTSPPVGDEGSGKLLRGGWYRAVFITVLVVLCVGDVAVALAEGLVGKAWA